MPTSANGRQTRHSIHTMFLERWSPRAFTDEDIPQADLLTILEAARWAPSAFNVQPWRFVYARRGGEAWDRFLSLLIPFNHRPGSIRSACVWSHDGFVRLPP